jgi:uncharacterized membrane protein
MSTSLVPAHVLAALLGLLAGGAALLAAKGGWLHRKSGAVFVYSMLAMSGTGAFLAVMKLDRLSALAGLLTFYLVGTGLLTLRSPSPRVTRLTTWAFFLALSVGGGAIAIALEAMAAGGKSLPLAVPSFVFGAVAMLAAVGDARVLRAGGLTGTPRLARHLWRMCFAMFIATASFFLGPASRLPLLLRHSPLRPIPVVLVLLMMLYSLARVTLGRGGGALPAEDTGGHRSQQAAS